MAGRTALQRRYLEAIGVELWERRGTPPPPASVDSLPAVQAQAQDSLTSTSIGAESGVATMGWETLERVVSGCRQCGLHTGRRQTVFGVGNRQADWMLIGEAPGEQEDLQGEPFVGRAGQLLNAMLAAIGLAREQVYIANVLKCRPPNNRDPQPQEVSCCEPYLQRQIALIAPRIILALGRHAAHSLLKTELPLSKLRGRRLNYHGTPLVASYHPAYLLRNPVDKRRAWDDLCLARTIVAGL